MKIIKIFSVLILCFAVANTIIGIFGLYIFNYNLYTDTHKATLKGVGSIPEEWFEGMLLTSKVFIIVGLISIIIGIGLLKIKEWARISWLILSALITGYEIFNKLNKHEYINSVWDVLGSILIILFALSSWIYFTRKETKYLFKGAT